MTLVDWFTRNWADTDEARDPLLAPLDIPVSVDEALARIRTAVERLPRWRIESWDGETGVLALTRRTRLWRFVDDITVRLEATATGTRVHARGQARIGVGDLGQNRRNLLELFRAFRAV